MPERREPLLADRFMRLVTPRHGLVHSKTLEQVKARLRGARKFVLDDAAIIRVGEVIRDIPDLIFRESQFARAPFDVTWIEISNFPLLWSTITGGEPSDTCDSTLGFLVDHDHVYTVAGGTRSDPAYPPRLMPISYMLKTPWLDDEREAFSKAIGQPLFAIDAASWGSTFNRSGGISIGDLKNPDHVAASLRKSHSMRLLPLRDGLDPKYVGPMLGSSAGELRDLIAILLLLNRPSLTRYVKDLPHTGGFVRGKLQAYFAHTVVTIDLDPQPTLKMLGTLEDDTVGRRRHEVRGHYCHNFDAREYGRIGCIHEWVSTYEDWTPVGDNYPDDEINHWRCAVCDGKRWWRDDYERGDAALGFVVKDYNVSGARNERRQKSRPHRS